MNIQPKKNAFPENLTPVEFWHHFAMALKMAETPRIPKKMTDKTSALRQLTIPKGTKLNVLVFTWTAEEVPFTVTGARQRPKNSYRAARRNTQRIEYRKQKPAKKVASR